MKVERNIRAKYRALERTLNERCRRLWAGTEAKVLGRGGIAIVIRATGLTRNTIIRGLGELAVKRFLIRSVCDAEGLVVNEQ